METRFDLVRLADPHIKEAERILKACVHCGFCLATCPTYLLLGDERDSPRGRIYMIKDMLEEGRPADATTTRHVDRCLSCLSCMTTCPSGVNYMHLVDHARAHIAETRQRPWMERFVRGLIARTVPNPGLFRLFPDRRPAGAALEWPAAQTARCHGASCTAPHSRTIVVGQTWGSSRPGRDPQTCRAVERLCPTGSDTPGQRGDHPSADPAGL